ncbi:MAG: PH domain-containing protein [Anaerolineae bacterium]
MTCRPKLSIGGPLGLLFVGAVLAMDWLLVHWLVDRSIRAQEINLGAFLVGLYVLLSLPLLAVLIYQTASWLSLRYRLDRNGIVIRSVGSEAIIPIREVQRILPGQDLGKEALRRRGLHWPGHERGVGMIPGIGRTRFLATRPLSEQLLLVTPGMAYGISPQDPEAFVRGFESRRELGPNRLLEHEERRAAWFTWPVWTDQTAWVLLGAALVINLALFGYLSIRFPGMDFQLPLHFNSLGQPDRIGTKMELFALPIIGLIVLGTNLALGLALYRRERAGSYLLWGAAAAAQALFWLATFSIVP